ncbi:MAG: ParA family protein [Planctomycetota bacterium]
MKVLACYNIKGGVGKTAAAVNLAYLAAAEGRRCLLVDLDPQGAATFYCRVKPKVKGGGRKLIKGKRTLGRWIRGTDFENLDLLPADFSYRNLDLFLDQTKRPTRRIRKLLRSLAEEYEVVYIDCAPSISLVSESVFHASDALLVPTIPTPLSLNTLEQLVRHLHREELDWLPVLPFFSMVDLRKGLHQQTIAESSSGPPPFLETRIPYSSLVEQMGTRCAPLPSYAPLSMPAQAFLKLHHEIMARLEGGN